MSGSTGELPKSDHITDVDSLITTVKKGFFPKIMQCYILLSYVTLLKKRNIFDVLKRSFFLFLQKESVK